MFAVAEIAQREQLESVVTAAQSVSISINTAVDDILKRLNYITLTLEEKKKTMASRVKEFSEALVKGTASHVWRCRLLVFALLWSATLARNRYSITGWHYWPLSWQSRVD